MALMPPGDRILSPVLCLWDHHCTHVLSGMGMWLREPWGGMYTRDKVSFFFF